MTSKTRTVTIDALAYGGDGVGHIDDKVIFVPDTVPGDTAEVTITEDKKSFFRGEVVELTTPSEARAIAFCKYADRCGGCQWQHVSYDEQLKWKQTIVDQTIKRLSGIDNVTVDPCVPSPVEKAFRTVARYPARRTKKGFISGYFERKSKRVIDIESCPVAIESINSAAAVIREQLRDHFTIVYIDEFSIQSSCRQDSILVTLFAEEGSDLSHIAAILLEKIPNLQGVSHRTIGGKFVKRYGEGYRFETVAGKEFRIEERSFFQINVQQAEQLIDIVRGMVDVDKPGLVIDGFGGVGLFSFGVFNPETEIHLYDLSRSAVKDSRFNAKAHGFKSFSTHTEDTQGMSQIIMSADTIILDPPRSGLGDEAVAASAALSAEKIVYISCNPTTLARDLKKFVSLGYSVERIVPVDMFPQTYHIETVTLLTKSV